MWLCLSGPMFSRLSSFKKLLLLACFERVCLGGCSLMSSYLTVDTSHEKLETNSDKEKRALRPLSGRRRGTCSASSIFWDRFYDPIPSNGWLSKVSFFLSIFRFLYRSPDFLLHAGETPIYTLLSVRK